MSNHYVENDESAGFVDDDDNEQRRSKVLLDCTVVASTTMVDLNRNIDPPSRCFHERATTILSANVLMDMPPFYSKRNVARGVLQQRQRHEEEGACRLDGETAVNASTTGVDESTTNTSARVCTLCFRQNLVGMKNKLDLVSSTMGRRKTVPATNVAKPSSDCVRGTDESTEIHTFSTLEGQPATTTMTNYLPTIQLPVKRRSQSMLFSGRMARGIQAAAVLSLAGALSLVDAWGVSWVKTRPLQPLLSRRAALLQADASIPQSFSSLDFLALDGSVCGEDDVATTKKEPFVQSDDTEDLLLPVFIRRCLMPFLLTFSIQLEVMCSPTSGWAVDLAPQPSASSAQMSTAALRLSSNWLVSDSGSTSNLSSPSSPLQQQIKASLQMPTPDRPQIPLPSMAVSPNTPLSADSRSRSKPTTKNAQPNQNQIIQALVSVEGQRPLGNDLLIIKVWTSRPPSSQSSSLPPGNQLLLGGSKVSMAQLGALPIRVTLGPQNAIPSSGSLTKSEIVDRTNQWTEYTDSEDVWVQMGICHPPSDDYDGISSLSSAPTLSTSLCPQGSYDLRFEGVGISKWIALPTEQPLGMESTENSLPSGSGVRAPSTLVLKPTS